MALLAACSSKPVEVTETKTTTYHEVNVAKNSVEPQRVNLGASSAGDAN